MSLALSQVDPKSSLVRQISWTGDLLVQWETLPQGITAKSGDVSLWLLFIYRRIYTHRHNPAPWDDYNDTHYYNNGGTSKRCKSSSHCSVWWWTYTFVRGRSHKGQQTPARVFSCTVAVFSTYAIAISGLVENYLDSNPDLLNHNWDGRCQCMS